MTTAISVGPAVVQLVGALATIFWRLSNHVASTLLTALAAAAAAAWMAQRLGPIVNVLKSYGMQNPASVNLQMTHPFRYDMCFI